MPKKGICKNSIIVIIALVFSIMLGTVSFAADPATLVGSSIYRMNDAATIKFYSDKEGTFYFYVSSDSATPTADEIKSATSGLYTGDAIVGTNIFSVGSLTTGSKYIYILVDNGSDSNILTIEIPYNIYYYEDFESYPLDVYISSGALSPISQIHDGNGAGNQKVVTSITEGKMLSLTSSGSWASDQIIKWNGMVPTTGVYVFEGDICTTYSSTETDSWLGRFTMTNGNYGSPNKEMGVHFKQTDIREAVEEAIALKDSFEKNTWYHIKIEAFPENNMNFVYIDGDKFGPFNIPSGIDRMAITAGHGFTTYFDNLVYYADPSLDVPSMKKVIVNNGVSSATDNIATEDDIITITANTPTNGLEFYKWTIISGAIELEDDHSSTTTFTMGTENVEIKAEYKAVIQGQLVYELSDTYGDGWNGNSIQIIDISGDTIVETLTISSGSTNNGTTANLEPGHIYNLYWNHGSFPGEASFKLKNSSGDVLFEGYGNVNLTESGVFFVVEIGDTEIAKTYTAKVSTTDVAVGEEIEGATLQILDEEGSVVSEWVSTKESHEVSELSGDIEYTLRNTVAPEGYTIATDTIFIIDSEGKVTSTGTMTEDGVMLVEIAKTHVDVLCTNDAIGATIQVLNSEGEIAEEWESTDEEHYIEGLHVDEEYTINVIIDSNSYEVCTFTIDEDGDVDSDAVDSEGVIVVNVEIGSPVETSIEEINATLVIPNAGTVVTMEGEDNSEYKSTQAPKPNVTIPSGVNYMIAVYDYFDDLSNATFWYVDSSATQLFSGEMIAGKTYYADLWFEPNDGYVISENVKIKVNSTQYDATTDGTIAYRVIIPVTIKSSSTPSSGSSSGGSSSGSSSSGGSSSSSSFKVSTKIENGTISPANANIKKNASQEFTFKANEGYEIVDVLVDGKSVGAVDKYTLDNVKEKHVIEVKTQIISALVNVDEWAKEEMAKAEELRLIPETFNKKDASKEISRADFCAVAVELYAAIVKNTVQVPENNPFTDTNDPYVLKAYSLGITKGISSTEFGNGTITREQMATMVDRALRKAGINITIDLENVIKFDDDNEMHDWGRPSIYAMAKEEIIKGIGNNKYDPLGVAKVEEALAISLRCIEMYKK